VIHHLSDCICDDTVCLLARAHAHLHPSFVAYLNSYFLFLHSMAHYAFVPFYVLSLTHGRGFVAPTFWRWALLPLVLYLFERAMRAYQLRQVSGAPFNPFYVVYVVTWQLCMYLFERAMRAYQLRQIVVHFRKSFFNTSYMLVPYYYAFNSFHLVITSFCVNPFTCSREPCAPTSCDSYAMRLLIVTFFHLTVAPFYCYCSHARISLSIICTLRKLSLLILSHLSFPCSW
jgi:hypothetical protein